MTITNSNSPYDLDEGKRYVVELRQDVINISDSVDGNNNLTLSTGFKLNGQEVVYEVIGKYSGLNTSTTLVYDPFIMAVYDNNRVYGLLNTDKVIISDGGYISVDDGNVALNLWEVVK